MVMRLDGMGLSMMPRSKLTAGGGDVVAFFAAQGGGDAGIREHFQEGFLLSFFRAFPGQAFDGVVGDEIDFGFDTAGAFHQRSRLLQAVIDAGDENVFEGEALFVMLLPIRQGFEELIERVFLVYRHDLVSHLIAGTVKGDREADLQGDVGEFFDLRGEAAGGDGHAACADTDAPVCIEDFDGPGEIGVVCEGFTHAHEDNVVDALAGVGFGMDNLFDDFGGGEVAGEAGEATGTEFAVVGAADLAGDAEGEAIRFLAVEGWRGGDQNGLDKTSVVKLEEEFLSGIGTAFDPSDGHRSHDGGICECFAQGFWEVCHGLKGDGAFFEDPFDQLFAAEAGLTEAGDEL
jgi:hypothetical protein